MIYFDHNATTPIKPAVRDLMLKMLDFPGNASAVHKVGRDSRRKIEESRIHILRALKADARAVLVFTSGATEANNLVLKGSGCERVLVSSIEHPSVLNVRSDAEIIPVLPNGIVDVAALDHMLEGNDRSTLISVMMVNNETGVIQPIDKIVAIARKRGALVHTDAVQALGRCAVDIQALGVDYMTLSSHKISGPQGVGCLVMANCVSVIPQMHGGNQEKNLRAGTENLAGIVAFGEAVVLAVKDIEAFQRLAVLRDKIESRLSALAPIKIFGSGVDRVVNTSMFALPGVASETQMIALDLAGICVSNGSACSSGTVKASHVLKAMGISNDEAESSLRISLGWDTTAKDVDAFIDAWLQMYERVKKKVKDTAHA